MNQGYHSNKFKDEEDLDKKHQKEMKDSSIDPLEDNPKIQAFRRELEAIALKHLGKVPENNTYSYPSLLILVVKQLIAGKGIHDDSLMPELVIFHKHETGIFEMDSYVEGGVSTYLNEGDWHLKVVYRNKRDERCVVVEEQASLVAQGTHGKKVLTIDEVFAPVARIEAYQVVFGLCLIYGRVTSQQIQGGSSYLKTSYVAEILKEIDLVNVAKQAITPMRDKIAFDKGMRKLLLVDVHFDKSMIGITPLHIEASLLVDYGGSNLDGKSTSGAGFAEIVDFLQGSNLRYALTSNPTIYDSLVKQFWQTATTNTIADGTLEIHATIDTIGYTITEASIRDTLQLADATGITMLPNDEIFEGMGQMGYPTDGTFTFWKSFFTPQWRYLVHHLLHCISSKSGGWDQFGSNIATALICLSTDRVYNFSKLIFDGMVANLKSKTKFLMYPRFLQLILNIQTENKHLYLAVTLTKKIFGNMKRGFRGAPRPLLPAMLLVATTNPNAGQEHHAVTQSQPSSSTLPVPSTSSPPVQSPPPIPTPTPTPIPATIPTL
ncbi:hypothetical protein Tco_0211971 [Tanacetum coccineum]